jgi:hypothetical protein
MTQACYRLPGGQHLIPAEAFHSISLTWRTYVNFRGTGPCFLPRVTRPNKLRHITLCKQHVTVKSLVSALPLSCNFSSISLPQNESITRKTYPSIHYFALFHLNGLPLNLFLRTMVPYLQLLGQFNFGVNIHNSETMTTV